MVATIQFVEQYEFWLYALCAAGALWYLRAYWRSTRELSRTIFGLEREAARGRQIRAASMMGTLFVIAALVFVIVTFIGPAVPAPTSAEQAAPTPGVSLTQSAAVNLIAGTAPPVSPLPTALSVDGAGCLNPEATLTSPTPAEVVSGVVEVKGTANTPGFGFYKFELSGPATGDNWNTVAAGNSPVVNATLGSLDTQRFTPGSYALRLVVFDAAGNSPAPCVVPIVIVGSQ